MRAVVGGLARLLTLKLGLECCRSLAPGPDVAAAAREYLPASREADHVAPCRTSIDVPAAGPRASAKMSWTVTAGCCYCGGGTSAPVSGARPCGCSNRDPVAQSDPGLAVGAVAGGVAPRIADDQSEDGPGER